MSDHGTHEVIPGDHSLRAKAGIPDTFSLRKSIDPLLPKTRSDWFRFGLNSKLLILWLWLFHPVFPYLRTIFTRQEFRLNQIVLVFVLILLGWQLWKGDFKLELLNGPHPNLPALLLALGGSGLFVLIERFLDINTLSASLFSLASYGLLGLWMDRRRWRQGLPAAILLIAALPFGEHLQTFIGYPVRVITASLVEAGLGSMGVSSASLDTILIFENGITQIDLPCSGVKSLWTGGIFLVAITWIDHHPLNLRWFLLTVTFVFLLLLANLIRVGILVAVGMVAQWQLLAEMLHVPLGVVGFVGACAAAILLLRWVGTFKQPEACAADFRIDPQYFQRSQLWLYPLILGSIVIMVLLYSPRPEPAHHRLPSAWVFPQDIAVEPWPLTPGEEEWLKSGGALAGNRWRFRWRDNQGSILLVTSDSWRAHHRPERCFQVYGLQVENSYTVLTKAGFPLRYLAMGTETGENQYSAMYWFQSERQLTDDHAARIWSDLSPDRGLWVLVTILMDQPVDPSSQEMQPFYQSVRLAVADNLEGGVVK